MWKIDVNRVRGKMAERGLTITSFAERLEINRNTLASYLECPNKTPYYVVCNMASILCDNTAEAISIFFACDFRAA